MLPLQRRLITAGLGFAAWLTLVGCSAPPLSPFEVQRPAKLSLDPKLQKIFIDPDLIQSGADQLGIKERALKALAKRLNALGRFQVVLGKPQGLDPNQEAFGVVQGNIISRQETEKGQLTEIATCQGGLGGLAGGIAGTQDKQGVTISRRGLLCRTDSATSTAVAQGVNLAISLLAGKEVETMPLDEVVRIYKYKNITLFAQFDLTLTLVGGERKVLTIRSDSASYGRHILKPAINVHESFVSLGEALTLFVLPISPVYSRQIGVVDASNPGSPQGNFLQNWAAEGEDMSPAERDRIMDKLIQEAQDSFVEQISPYKALIYAQIAEGGQSKAVEALKRGQWQEVKNLLGANKNNSAEDWYNLGLAYEAAASSDAHYLQAKEHYEKAFAMDQQIIFAQGIGRMEQRIKEAFALRQQTQKNGT